MYAINLKQRNDVLEKPVYTGLTSGILCDSYVTMEKLSTVENAENILRGLGFGNVRVRHCGDTALIELSTEDFRKVLELQLRSTIINKFKRIGYTYVTVDLEGYRSGSMKKTITKEENG